MQRGQAEALPRLIGQVSAGRLQRIARIAVCTGPGSFAGLRSGIAMARGMALGLGCPCIGISRFEAIAAGTSGTVSVVLASRDGQLLCQKFMDGAPVEAPDAIEALPSGVVLGDLPGRESAALPDPLHIAELARDRVAAVLPSPLYLRNSGAAPRSDMPPVMLD